MCRALGYLGPALPLAHVLHHPDHSLLDQSYDPKQLHMLNLAGFGLTAWTDLDASPLTYRSTAVPIYDTNLASLARHVRSHCVLAHVRGIPYRPSASFGAQNLHPFHHPGTELRLAHNGDLADFHRLRPALLARLAPERTLAIRGTTDSEWIYALLLHHLGEQSVTPDTLGTALRSVVATLREARAEAGIDTSSSMNLFISDGHVMAAARYTFDFGRYPLDPDRVHDGSGRYLSLWYTVGQRFDHDADGRWHMTPSEGRPAALLAASEPLSIDPGSWVEVSEYTALLAHRTEDGVALRSLPLEE